MPFEPLRALADRYTLEFVDRRGCGGSLGLVVLPDRHARASHALVARSGEGPAGMPETYGSTVSVPTIPSDACCSTSHQKAYVPAGRSSIVKITDSPPLIVEERARPW